jgi:glutamyl-tRNA reductase
VHAETGIDQAGQTIISVALAATEPEIGRIEGRRVLVVGAGSMAALAVATAQRAGAGQIVVASRTTANARRLASKVSGRTVKMADLEREIAAADLVISCTGATGSVITLAHVEAALMLRDPARPLVVADMALPHDVDAEVASLPGVTIVDLQTVATHGHEGAGMDDVAAVRDIVADEVVAFTNARDAARVAPTVVALRTMATAVASAELDRLWARLGELTPDQRSEIEQAVRRVADKLLHEPTVRVKEFAGRTPEASYAEALAALFALDPAAVDAVTRAGDTS